MPDAADWLSALAAVLALALSLETMRRQRVLETRSYLILGLEVGRVSPDRLLAATSLENRSPHVKHLDVVFLLVGPAEETPTQTFNAVLAAHGHGEVADISEFGRTTKGIAARCSAGDRQYLRLEYYTAENSEVGDELLTYDAVLDASALRPGQAYGVRLFLYGQDRLHRVVHRAVIG